MKVDELTPRSSRVNMPVKVLTLDEPRDIESGGRVCEGLVGDETGTIIMSFWNEECDQVKLGETIWLNDARASLVRGSLRLSLGKYGSLGEGDTTPTHIRKSIPAATSPSSTMARSRIMPGLVVLSLRGREWLALPVGAACLLLPWLALPGGEWLGLRGYGYTTVDYFPLKPWLGVFLLAYFAGSRAYADGRPRLPHEWPAALLWLGRHTLPIYLLHQPVIVGMLLLASAVSAGRLLP